MWSGIWHWLTARKEGTNFPAGMVEARVSLLEEEKEDAYRQLVLACRLVNQGFSVMNPDHLLTWRAYGLVDRSGQIHPQVCEHLEKIAPVSSSPLHGGLKNCLFHGEAD